MSCTMSNSRTILSPRTLLKTPYRAQQLWASPVTCAMSNRTQSPSREQIPVWRRVSAVAICVKGVRALAKARIPLATLAFRRPRRSLSVATRHGPRRTRLLRDGVWQPASSNLTSSRCTSKDTSPAELGYSALILSLTRATYRSWNQHTLLLPLQ